MSYQLNSNRQPFSTPEQLQQIVTTKKRKRSKKFFSAKEKSSCNYMESIRTGNQEGLNNMYQDFLPKIVAYICRRGGSAADAEDIFQETLILIHQKLQDPTFKIPQNVGGYVMSICKNLWLNQHKKNARTTSDVSIRAFAEQADGAELVDRLMIKGEKKELFEAKFKSLPTDAQRLLTLFFEGKKMKEIAKIMGYGSVSYAKKKKCLYQKKLITMIQSDPLSTLLFRAKTKTAVSIEAAVRVYEQ